MTYDETRLKKLLRRLDSQYLATRNAAIAEAHRLPAEVFQRLVEMEARWFRQRSVRRRIIGAVLLTLLWYGGLLSLPGTFHKNYCWSFFPVWMHRLADLFELLISFGIMTWPAYSVWRFGVKATRARQSLTEAIQKLPEGERLPLLLILLQTKSKTVRGNLRYMLQQELKRLRADDAERLTSSQKTSLAAMLDHPYENVDLTLNVLKALEQVGGEEAVPAVQKLADRVDKTKKHAIVHYAARECLPYLQNHAQERRNAQVLLRPTVPDAVPASQLLRPISNRKGETSSEHLLRPVTLTDDAPGMTSDLHIANRDGQVSAHDTQANENVEKLNSYSHSGENEAPNVLLAGTRK